MTDRILRAPDVQRITGLSMSTIWRQEKTGLFPKRRVIGAKAVGWLESEINDWLSSRCESISPLRN